MELIKTVLKKDGTVAEFNAEKLNKWAEWACEDTECQWSWLLTNALKKMYNGISTKDLQRCLIDTAEDMMQIDSDYSNVAGKLLLAEIRKEALGGFQPPTLQEFYHQMVRAGLWEDMGYSDSDLDTLGRCIKHERDVKIPYAGIKQMYDKYLIRSTVTGTVHETPQFMYIGMAMSVFKGEPLKDVISLYSIFSRQKVNAPTPVLVGLRTGDNGFASCCVISTNDTLQSINAGQQVAYTMTANRAGIGFEMETRTEGEPVGKGTFSHQGKLAYYKLIDKTVKSNTQQSRGGSATMQFAIFDPQIETLLRLKSQRVSEEVRVDKIDYSLAINNYFLRKFVEDKDIMLVSPKQAPKLHELFYGKDLNNFIEEYDRVEADTSIIKKFIEAREVFGTFAKERLDTGRIYCHRVDEVNRRSTFKDAIRSSNLCQEISIPSKGYTDVPNLYLDEEDGEVGLCNLAGICVGRVTDREYERTAYILLKMVDVIIDIQVYPYKSLEYTNRQRRSVGIGLINVANAIAKEGLSYETEEGRNYIHRIAERHSYWLHKASVRLAKEKGRNGWFERTTYADSTLLIDNYSKEIDSHHSQELVHDWEALREEIKEHGMRHSVLEAMMPSETSSVSIGATNGVEPIRQLITFKNSNTGSIPFQVPDYKRLKDNYELAFDIDNKEYIKFIAIIQKFTGQSISYNEYYNYNKYPNGIIPMSIIMENFLMACKLGIKTFYYLNSDVSNGGASHEIGCESGACTI